MSDLNIPGPKLEFLNNILHFNGHQLNKYTDKYSTPFYLYDLEVLKENYLAFKTSLETNDIKNHLVCYAVKANPHPCVLEQLNKLNSGADVVSIGELRTALDAGIPSEKIVFSGVGKSDDEIKESLTLTNGKIKSINIESIDELQSVEEIARDLNLTANVALRYNPSTMANTHEYIATGGEQHKFGLNESEVSQAIEQINNMSFVMLRGLSMHIGSQLTDMKATESALNHLGEISKNLPNLQFINVGGGLGIKYTIGQKDICGLDEYLKVISFFIKRFSLSEKVFIFEPGRFLIGNAGILITKVIRTKRNFKVVDAGMNDFMRPCLYGTYHQIFPFNKRSTTEKVNIVGPICETGDFFARDVELSEIIKGDFVSISNTGAYGKALANTYNSREMICEYFID